MRIQTIHIRQSNIFSFSALDARSNNADVNPDRVPWIHRIEPRCNCACVGHNKVVSLPISVDVFDKDISKIGTINTSCKLVCWMMPDWILRSALVEPGINRPMTVDFEVFDYPISVQVGKDNIVERASRNTRSPTISTRIPSRMTDIASIKPRLGSPDFIQKDVIGLPQMSALTTAKHLNQADKYNGDL